MRYSYEKLVTVSFMHDYFSNGVFGGLIAEPTDNTSRELLNHGLLLKQVNGGFHLLFDRESGSGSRERADLTLDGITCTFVLRLRDDSFYNYTEPVDGNLNKELFHFHNTAKKANTLKKSLHSGKYVSGDDLVALADIPERFFVRPFGILELRLAEGLEDNYTIRFKARETHWRYIIVNDDLRSLNNPAILDSSAEAVFDGPETLALPGREAIAFRSKEPISFSQRSGHIFQLVDNYDPDTGRYRVIKRALPAADPGYISLVETGATNRNLNFSEIFIH